MGLELWDVGALDVYSPSPGFRVVSELALNQADPEGGTDLDIPESNGSQTEFVESRTIEASQMHSIAERCFITNGALSASPVCITVSQFGCRLCGVASA